MPMSMLNNDEWLVTTAKLQAEGKFITTITLVKGELTS